MAGKNQRSIDLMVEGNRIKQVFVSGNRFYRYPSDEEVKLVINHRLAFPGVNIESSWGEFKTESALLGSASEEVDEFLRKGILSAYHQKPESRQANGILVTAYDHNLLRNKESHSTIERALFYLVKYHDNGKLHTF